MKKETRILYISSLIFQLILDGFYLITSLAIFITLKTNTQIYSSKNIPEIISHELNVMMMYTLVTLYTPKTLSSIALVLGSGFMPTKDYIFALNMISFYISVICSIFTIFFVSFYILLYNKLLEPLWLLSFLFFPVIDLILCFRVKFLPYAKDLIKDYIKSIYDAP